jgi:hypothetical protein
LKVGCPCERSEAIAPVQPRRSGAIASLRSQRQTNFNTLYSYYKALSIKFLLYNL